MSTMNGLVFVPEVVPEGFPREVRLFFPEGQAVELMVQVLTYGYELVPMEREGPGEPFMFVEDAEKTYVLQGHTLHLTLSRWERCDKDDWAQTSEDIEYFPKRRI